MTGLTGVYPDKTARGCYGDRWVAVWRVETTTGPHFIHRRVSGLFQDRASAEFAAAGQVPEEILRLRKLVLAS